MPSRDLNDLHPEFKPVAEKFLQFVQRLRIPLLVTCTYRSAEEQDRLYAQGRTSPGHRVTNASGGESPHNNTINGQPAALAFDVVFGSSKKVFWKGPWYLLGKISKFFGLEWGGDWKRKDSPHFQQRNKCIIPQ